MYPILIFTFGFSCGGLFALAACVWYATRDAPRMCAFSGCTTSHTNLEPFCSHHILDEYEEEHGRGSGPGKV